jgi:cytochrome d ubiquinol oxidase subunit II
MLNTVWFCLVAIMIVGYVVLDGFDLGAGIVHLFVARNDEERRKVLKTVGPVWDGNEVWLLAGGGTLYFAFPGLYASSFSGFYLPLMVVLWLLMIRGISIEFRNHIDSPTWKPIWDAGFAFASLLLVIFFGAALGNVVRGVPLDNSGDFFLPFWTDFQPGAAPGILDWYTILVALFALATLTMHGGLWVIYKTDGDLNARTRVLVSRVWVAVAALTAVVTFVSWRIQPQIWKNFQSHPWGWIFPVIALAGLFGARFLRSEFQAFLASCAYIVGMLTSVAFGVFPYVLPSNTDPNLGLTIYNTAPAPYGLKVGLAWWIPGMILATIYSVFVYRKFAGKVRLDEAGY